MREISVAPVGFDSSQHDLPQTGRVGDPCVSILIAAFNCEAFIERAIRSATNQHGVSLEVIVIDDASQDDTCRVINDIAQLDPRIRLVRSSVNGGPAAARNIGIESATGDWIAILDADDAFAPQRLAYLLDTASRYNCDIIADNFVYYDAGSDTCSAPALETLPSIETIDLYSFVRNNGASSKDADFGLLKPIFSKAFLLNTGLRYPQNVRHGEDWELVFEALKLGASYVLARDRATYLYTTRDSGFSRTRISYELMAERTLGLAKIARKKGDRLLAKLLRERARQVRRVHLDFLGSMPGSSRPRWKMLLTAIRFSAGRRWLLARAKSRLRSAAPFAR